MQQMIQPDENTLQMAKTMHPIDNAGVQARLRQLIDEKFNGTQGDLADLAGIQRSAMSMILNGRGVATVKQLRKIEKATRARFDWLVSGAEPMFHPFGWIGVEGAPTKEGEYFQQFIIAHKVSFTQAQLATALGVARSVITDYFKTAKFDIITRQSIVRALQKVMGDNTITDENVFSGSDTLTERSAEAGLQIRPLGNMSAEPIIELPFVPIRARAGIPTPAFWEQRQETTRIMRATLVDVEPNPAKPKYSWWVIEIDGDSMEPQLISRARVLAYYVPKENVADLKPGVWAVQYDDEFVIKRIRTNTFERDGGIMCHSDNPPPDPFFVKAEAINHVWYIVKVVDSPIR